VRLGRGPSNPALRAMGLGRRASRDADDDRRSTRHRACEGDRQRIVFATACFAAESPRPGRTRPAHVGGVTRWLDSTACNGRETARPVFRETMRAGGGRVVGLRGVMKTVVRVQFTEVEELLLMDLVALTRVVLDVSLIGGGGH